MGSSPAFDAARIPRGSHTRALFSRQTSFARPGHCVCLHSCNKEDPSAVGARRARGEDEDEDERRGRPGGRSSRRGVAWRGGHWRGGGEAPAPPSGLGPRATAHRAALLRWRAEQSSSTEQCSSVAWIWPPLLRVSPPCVAGRVSPMRGCLPGKSRAPPPELCEDCEAARGSAEEESVWIG
ncbi:unnamed protein product [Urochloa humidicola]